MRIRSKRTAPALLTALLAGLLPSLSVATPAHAAGTSYYLDNRAGSNCADSGAGTQQQPWCTFAPVNARTFSAGDRILLARGAQWREGMTLTGSGTAAQRIELSAYGSGPGPLILKGAANNGISLLNASHWAVKGLEIDGHGSQKMIYGIVAAYKGAEGIGHEDLTFADLHVHHTHMGIYVAGNASPTADQWAVKGVRMDSVKGEHNEVSIAFGDDRGLDQFVQDAVLTRLELSNDDGDPAVYKGCPNSLTLQSMTRVTVMNSLISHAGGCTVPTGTTGIYLGHVTGADITNNIIAFTQQSGSPDQSGVNYEGWVNDAALRGNLITGNTRWGVALQAIHTGGPNRDTTVESNAIVFNGQPPVAALGSAAPGDGVIRDNLWEGTGLTTEVSGGDFDGFAFAGNAGPVTGGRVWYAARDFATGQGIYGWHYQYSSDAGATWADLAYNQADESWRPAGGTSLPLVEKWDWHPAGPSGYVARAWTAPRDGTVAIRGQAAKTDLGGDGVRVRITRNGGEVLSPRTVTGSDRVGVATDVDSLAVKAGDTLRFILDSGSAGANSYDTTSWTPVIGYLD